MPRRKYKHRSPSPSPSPSPTVSPSPIGKGANVLNKVKVMLLLGVFLQIIRNFFPALEIPTDFEKTLETLVNVLYVVIPVVAAWFTKETENTVRGLTLKR